MNLLKSVIRVCQPSVVHIKAIKGETDEARRTRTIEEAGAGVIFRHNGHHFVLTNRHVVKFAELSKIHIYTLAGQHANPERLWTDAATDIAVLQLPKGNFVPARYAEAKELEVGDFVVAIGSPFGLNHSVSYGIVSALGRRDLQLGDDGVRYQDFIQTDAAINPGNSGGPLINLRGEVVGINTAIASNSGHNEGIGFSIPIKMVLEISRQLVEQGKVTRGFLGVSLDASFTPDLAKAMGLDSFYGARISGVTPESPAEVAQLEVGDVILDFGGVQIQNDSHLVTQVSRATLGQAIPLKIFRKGRLQEIKVTLQSREAFLISQSTTTE
jgi:serine protease Do